MLTFILLISLAFLYVTGCLNALIWSDHERHDEETGEMRNRTWKEFTFEVLLWFIDTWIIYYEAFRNNS